MLPVLGLCQIYFIVAGVFINNIKEEMTARNRSHSCFSSFPHSLKTSYCISRPASSLVFMPAVSKNKRSPDKGNKINRSRSSIWRAVCAARCDQHLEKETIQPIRRNLSQKKIRLEAKRAQQQRKYTKTIQIIRKKSGPQTYLKKQHFKQARNLIDDWAAELKLEKDRYYKRLLKHKQDF